MINEKATIKQKHLGEIKETHAKRQPWTITTIVVTTRIMKER